MMPVTGEGRGLAACFDIVKIRAISPMSSGWRSHDDCRIVHFRQRNAVPVNDRASEVDQRRR
ncbi:MAG: hypothetical protein ACK46T_31630, partial [Bradyrhizobium sp.]